MDTYRTSYVGCRMMKLLIPSCPLANLMAKAFTFPAVKSSTTEEVVTLDCSSSIPEDLMCGHLLLHVHGKKLKQKNR